MKVKINIVEDKSKEEAIINTCELSSNISEAKALLENVLYTVTGYKDGNTYQIDANKIYYIESIDNKTFIYTKTDSYECRLKLYELEELLDKKRFLRCSKSMILNIRKINSIKADINARFMATLLNNEIIIISRSYAKELKLMLGI